MIDIGAGENIESTARDQEDILGTPQGMMTIVTAEIEDAIKENAPLKDTKDEDTEITNLEARVIEIDILKVYIRANQVMNLRS